MAHSISVILHSLSTWWHPNIEKESFALKFGNLPVNSRGMVMGFGQLCILNYSHQNLVGRWNCDIKVSKYKIIYVPCYQSCPTLWDLMDCSPPGSSVHGILQARILEWVAMPSSRGSSQSRDQTQVSCTIGRFFTIWATREAQEYWSG